MRSENNNQGYYQSVHYLPFWLLVFWINIFNKDTVIEELFELHSF